VSLSTDGTTLEAVWRRPFTHEGFPVTSYSLTVTNKTTGQPAGKLDVTSDLTRELLMYDLRRPVAAYTDCHSLIFSVIARNSVGTSITGDTVVVGFPVCELEHGITRVCNRGFPLFPLYMTLCR